MRGCNIPNRKSKPASFTRPCLLQVSWHALRGRLLSISLADVYLCASPRSEADWEEGPAGERARKAKRALLAAVEMERLSKPAGTAAVDRGSNGSMADNTGRPSLSSLPFAVQRCGAPRSLFPKHTL